MNKLQVTVTYSVEVHDLEHYEADTLDGAARNLESWYWDGSADMAEDLCNVRPDSISVVPVAAAEEVSGS